MARCRVSELWSDDPDQPCSPPQRATGQWKSSVEKFKVTHTLRVAFAFPQVQQRGALAASQILSGVMEGLEARDSSPVFVIDLTANRQGSFGFGNIGSLLIESFCICSPSCLS